MLCYDTNSNKMRSNLSSLLHPHLLSFSALHPSVFPLVAFACTQKWQTFLFVRKFPSPLQSLSATIDPKHNEKSAAWPITHFCVLIVPLSLLCHFHKPFNVFWLLDLPFIFLRFSRLLLSLSGLLERTRRCKLPSYHRRLHHNQKHGGLQLKFACVLPQLIFDSA